MGGCGDTSLIPQSSQKNHVFTNTNDRLFNISKNINKDNFEKINNVFFIKLKIYKK